MKLVSFSVENFRSITNARRIPLSDYSLLVGANNEGKSNILHALILAMNALIAWRGQIRRTIDGRMIRSQRRMIDTVLGGSEYNWETDFPVSKQAKSDDSDATKIVLEFELNEGEIAEFKSEIKSNLNGTLPLSISFQQRSIEVSVKKQGRGGVSLTRKSNRIAEFVSKRIQFEYIPAIRTADAARKVIAQLVEQELSLLKRNQDYTDALAKIEELQQPVYDALAQTIKDTISSFLPNIRSVKLNRRRAERYGALRGDVEIVVDDGHLTKLERKGEGVQSLVALALMRHASQQHAQGLSKVIAIEEPESHLHPRAVHELRSVIETLSEDNQVVLTSHSPLFVNPNDLSSTIIVKGSKAVCAEKVMEVREALGVRFSDNLQNARLVLLVEGTDDVKALKAIISSRSEVLKNSLNSGVIALDYLGGVSALRQKASYYRSGACMVQCFVDDDNEARVAVGKAISDNILHLKDINQCAVPHLKEAELEDIYDKNIFREDFVDEFGVDPKAKIKSRNDIKFSERMGVLFRNAGKPWDNVIKFAVKNWLADYASSNPNWILVEELSGPLLNFIQTAEDKIRDSKNIL